MRIQDNVAYGLKAMHLPKDRSQKRTVTLLDFVGVNGNTPDFIRANSAADKNNAPHWPRSLATEPAGVAAG